jgi:hypothetical protein
MHADVRQVLFIAITHNLLADIIFNLVGVINVCA